MQTVRICYQELTLCVPFVYRYIQLSLSKGQRFYVCFQTERECMRKRFIDLKNMKDTASETISIRREIHHRFLVLAVCCTAFPLHI